MSIIGGPLLYLEGSVSIFGGPLLVFFGGHYSCQFVGLWVKIEGRAGVFVGPIILLEIFAIEFFCWGGVHIYL